MTAEPRNRPSSGATTGRGLLLAGLAGAAAAGLWAVARAAETDADAPRVAFRVGDRTDLEPFSQVPPMSRVSLELTLARPAHVYAVSHDLTRGTIALVPSTQLRTDVPSGPLPAGTHRLPGTHDGVVLHWPTGDALEPVGFVLVVSDRRLEDLERCLASCRQMGNTAFPKREVLDPYAPEAGMDAVPAAHALPHPVLQAAAREVWSPDAPGLARIDAGGFEVHATTLHLQHGAAGPEAAADGALEARIRARLDEALRGSPARILTPGEGAAGPRPPK